MKDHEPPPPQIVKTPRCSMSLEVWLAEVKLIYRLMGWSKLALDTFPTEAYQEYFTDGFTPAEAIEEDLSNT